jgi:hypothetical protein
MRTLAELEANDRWPEIKQAMLKKQLMLGRPLTREEYLEIVDLVHKTERNS